MKPRWRMEMLLTCSKQIREGIKKSNEINGMHDRPSGMAKRGRSRSNSPEQVCKVTTFPS